MRDIHCHILPGVDDGAQDLEESLQMLAAAKRVGITSIVCTPHCRDPWFDSEAMHRAFELLCAHANGFPLTMGFEVNISKLYELGVDYAPNLAFSGSNEFLLELRTHADAYDFREYERVIYELQALGLEVIIAHPERYDAIKHDIGIAEHLVELGCVLQASADYIVGGRLGNEKRIARKLMKAGLYTYIASDAHCPEHYEFMSRAYAKHSGYLH